MLLTEEELYGSTPELQKLLAITDTWPLIVIGVSVGLLVLGLVLVGVSWWRSARKIFKLCRQRRYDEQSRRSLVAEGGGLEPPGPCGPYRFSRPAP